MSTKPATLPAKAATAGRAAPTTAQRLTRQERTLRQWNRLVLLGLAVILGCMAVSLFLVPAPPDPPELPAMIAGFGLVRCWAR